MQGLAETNCVPVVVEKNSRNVVSMRCKMKKTYRVKRQTARNRDALLEAQYYKQEVSKAADEFNEQVIAKLQKHGITVKVSQ